MSTKPVKGAIYPPDGVEPKDLTDEQLANLTAQAGYKEYDWYGQKYTREEKIQKVADNYVTKFKQGWHPNNQIKAVCHSAYELYSNGVHESLVIEWVKRIGAISVRKENNPSHWMRGQSCWATSPLTYVTEPFIYRCTATGIRSDFRALIDSDDNSEGEDEPY